MVGSYLRQYYLLGNLLAFFSAVIMVDLNYCAISLGHMVLDYKTA